MTLRRILTALAAVAPLLGATPATGQDADTNFSDIQIPAKSMKVQVSNFNYNRNN